MKKIILIFSLIFLSLYSFSQPGQLGALQISDSDYAKLPRPNWSIIYRVLRDYNNTKNNLE